MNRTSLALGILSCLASLPLVLACGAAPNDTTNEGAATDEVGATEVGTSSEAQQVSQPAAATTIGFDADPSLNLVANGATVDSLYWASGVTFSCDSCSTHSVYARNPGRTANGVSIIAKDAWNTPPGFDAARGVARATFNRVASSVSIDANCSPDPNANPFIAPQGAPWLIAYDASDTIVGQASYTATCGQWQTLSIYSSSYNIAYVRFSSSAANTYPDNQLGTFDNLRFDKAPVVKPPPILPPRIQ